MQPVTTDYLSSTQRSRCLAVVYSLCFWYPGFTIVYFDATALVLNHFWRVRLLSFIPLKCGPEVDRITRSCQIANIISMSLGFASGWLYLFQFSLKFSLISFFKKVKKTFSEKNSVCLKKSSSHAEICSLYRIHSNMYCTGSYKSGFRRRPYKHIIGPAWFIF